MAENTRKYTFTVSERVADTIDFEASLAGIDPKELFRRGIATFIMDKQVEREITGVIGVDNMDILPLYLAIDHETGETRMFRIKRPTEFPDGDQFAETEEGYNALIKEVTGPDDLL